jgi:hypothetical protein
MSEHDIKSYGRKAVAKKSVDWETVALESLDALRLFNAHYEDLAKSNPGFLGKLVLQDFALLNEALLASDRVLKKYSSIANASSEEKR